MRRLSKIRISEFDNNMKLFHKCFRLDFFFADNLENLFNEVKRIHEDKSLRLWPKWQKIRWIWELVDKSISKPDYKLSRHVFLEMSDNKSVADQLRKLADEIERM